MEGRVQKQMTVSLVEAQEDWQIINQISKLLSYDFYKSVNDLNRDLIKEYPIFTNSDENIIKNNNISVYKAAKKVTLNQNLVILLLIL